MLLRGQVVSCNLQTTVKVANFRFLEGFIEIKQRRFFA